MIDRAGSHPLRFSAACAYGVTLALAAAWTAGALVASLQSAAETEPSLAWRVYGFLCHQMPERSLHLDGHPLAVCTRCLGIYAGYILGLVFYPFARSITREDAPDRRWLLLALTPLSVDSAGGMLGLFENTQTSRLLTGALAGFAAAFFTLPGLVSVALQVGRFRRTVPAPGHRVSEP